MSKLRIIPLGGVEEIGINCTVFEYNNRIMVVDVGLGFPEDNMYGVDYVVPNIDYLIKNANKIDGIIITHGHLDHIGALPYLLPKLDFPEVYGTEFTIELIKAKLEDHSLLNKAKLHVIKEDSVLKADQIQVEFFRVNHSIPQCVGLVIKTPVGNIVHTGDFKFDNSPVNEPVADYARIARIGEAGVDLMLADSTNALKKGHPVSESDVAASLSDIIERASGRVVIASFSGLVGRLYQVIKVAEKLGRKVAIAGYGMNQSFRIAQEIGYIKPKAGIIVPISNINRFSDNRVIIITTGAQGESNAALSRMASKEGYKNLFIKPKDTIVLSAATIPGNNKDVQVLTDLISSRGAKVIQSENFDLFTSGHGYQEDHKLMLNLVKPKFFMPVHGYQYFLRAHGQTAVQVGVKDTNIIISKRGSIIEGNKDSGFQIVGQIAAEPWLVSGSGVGEVGETLLAERQQLGNNGVVVIGAAIDAKTKRLLTEPSIYTKGFVFAKKREDLLSKLREIAKLELTKSLRDKISFSVIRERIEQKITAYVEKEIERTPIIITTINLVGGADRDILDLNRERSPEYKPSSQHKPNSGFRESNRRRAQPQHRSNCSSNAQNNKTSRVDQDQNHSIHNNRAPISKTRTNNTNFNRRNDNIK